MVRKARGISDNGLFHVIQTAYNQTRLFETDEDREAFLMELNRLHMQMNFDLISYCLKEDLGYQLVLRLYNTDLSKVMKSLNIGYAMYKKSEYPLFKDRYKSKKIEESNLDALLKYIHGDNPILTWSVCCNKLADKEDCQDCIRTIQEAQKWLDEQLSLAALNQSLPIKDKNLRNEWILKLRRKSTLSLKEIGHVFGITESSVSKVLKK